jgi:transcriptional regulator with XRE-family HTH domain
MVSSQRISRQVGAALRRVRERRCCWQYQLAEAAGISQRQLAAYERGRQQPSIATLTALDCSADEFGRHLGPWGILPA